MNKKLAVIPILAVMTSCTALDIDGARFAGSLSNIDATATTEITTGGETFEFEDEANGDFLGGRVELVNKSGPNTEVSLVLGVSQGELEEADLTNYDAGMAVRHYFTQSTVRPFAEVGVGYRSIDVSIPELGDDRIDAGWGTASLGLDFQVSSNFSFFVSGGYGGSIGKDFDMHGPMGSAGITITF